MLPNRIALYMGAAAAFLGGLAPLVANLDWQSTAGLIAGLAAIATFVNTFVIGYQKHEARQARPVTTYATGGTYSAGVVGTTGGWMTGTPDAPIPPSSDDQLKDAGILPEDLPPA